MTSTIIGHKISARMTYRRRVRRRRLKSLPSVRGGVLSEEANWRTKTEVIHNEIAVSLHIVTWRSVSSESWLDVNTIDVQRNMMVLRKCRTY